MFKIGNFRIITKLALMLTLPILSLVYYSFLNVQERQAEITELQHLADLTSIAVQIGGFVHEVQKERGRTTLFLAAQGKTFRKELDGARMVTDEEGQSLYPALQMLQSEQSGTVLAATVQKVQPLIDILSKTRAAVDNLKVSSQEPLDYYTTLNARLLDIIEVAATNIHFSARGNRLTAYLMLLRGKDLVGLERAETGQAIHRRQLPRDRLARLVELRTFTKAFFQRFNHLTEKEDQDFLNQKLKTECVVKVAQIQNHLLGLNKEEIVDLGVDATRWFDLITCKIDRLKQIEDHMVDNLQAMTETHLATTHRDFIVFITVSAIATMLTLLLVVVVVRHLTIQTRLLVRSMQIFSAGKLEARVVVTSNDELGRIGGSFNRMAAQIEENTIQGKQRVEDERQEAERFRKRVKLLGEALAHVSKGDLSRRISEEGTDELAKLGQGLNAMIKSLADMARQTEETIHALSTSLEQVQHAAQVQSSGASQQASAISETTTTLEEIRAVSGQTLDKAQLLGNIAERAKAEGEQGRLAVEQTLAAMHGIRKKVDTIAQTILALSERTLQIGEITSAVNNLAQQSKMLALNASIEAAKAGEAGKGFAVVADEVKNLAEQSQQFTTQVHRILEEIRHATDKAVMATEEGNKEVDQGTNLTEQGGTVVRNLLEMVRETAMSSQQIVAAVRQEAAGIDQIGTAMGEINQVTTQFVLSTRQTVQATDDLGKLSASLGESIRFYKV